MLETTETLLQELAVGNQNRWARFYRDYAPLIERTLMKRGISHDDAEYPPRPPHDANLTNAEQTVYAAYIVEPGAKLVFTDNPDYPESLIERR